MVRESLKAGNAAAESQVVEALRSVHTSESWETWAAVVLDALLEPA